MPPKLISSRSTRRQLLHAVIDQKVFVAQNVGGMDGISFVRLFRPELPYHPLCDDFGPMNIASVVRFIELLDKEIASFPAYKIVYSVEPGRRNLTNAVFLLGAYMILKLDATSQDLSICFQWLDSSVAEPFRDATFMPSDFDLSLLDCWRGLEQGKSLGWIRLPTAADPAQWGKINIDEYRHYEDPSNGDLAQVVPGMLVAFRGPVDLGGRDYHDDESGYRSLSPLYYARIFRLLGVRAVVRLNEAEYDGQVFEEHGISHHDLEFPDCTVPPARIVAAFLKIVDSTGGPVAVHCKAGLGRTGTLIARYMMRSQGFGAREAMGWLRIMRPGSVIGQQQHYLCSVERPVSSGLAVAAAGRESRAAAAAGRDTAVAAGRPRSAERCAAEASRAEQAAAQVAAAMRRRAAERGMTR